MKSEHRHELQTNDLSKLTQKGARFVEEHALKITIIICVIAVAVAAYRIFSTRSFASQSTAWYEFSNARTADDFLAVADSDLVKGTPAADWALLMGAEMRLSQAVQLMFTDRANAVTELTSARDDFNKLVENDDSMIKQRAIFGLARTEESLGNLEAARAAYKQLGSDEFKGSVYHKQAQERAEYLEKAGPQAFYAWFQKQNPKPPEPRKPDTGGGAPASDIFSPGDFPELPELPETPFGTGNPLQGLPNEDDSDDEGPADSQPKLEAPADDDSKPSAETPEAPKTPTEPSTEADTDGAADNSDDAK